MDIAQTKLLAALVIFIFMNLAFLLAKRQNNAGLIDVGWGLGFVVTTYVLFASRELATLTHVLLMSLILLWGLRLALHLGRRNFGAKEDWRYAKWRQEWGDNYWWRGYFQFFMLQGLVMYLVMSPVIVGFSTTAEPTLTLATIGVFIWWVGFLFEAIADKQLADFRARKKSGATKKKIMNEGLWRYSRHPNYFGEVALWWGLWLMVAGLPYGMFAVIGPLTITYLILFVSGVPLLEKKHAKDAAFQRYAKKTSKFLPLPPKS